MSKTLDKLRQVVGRGAAVLRAPVFGRPAGKPVTDASVMTPDPAERGASVTDAVPDNRDAALSLGAELLASNRGAQALEIAHVWLERDPADADFRRLAGFAQKALRMWKDAAVNLELVRERRGGDPALLRGLGEIYDALGSVNEAAERWQMLIDVTEGEDVAALTALGIDLSRAGDHGRAIAMLQAVANRMDDSSAAHADLGMALLTGGRINDAVEVFSKARALDPASAQAHCGLGLAYQGLERWHEATEAFAETERLAPESAVGPFNLGMALAKLGDWKGMRHALLRAASIEPDDPEIQEALGRLFMTAGGDEDADEDTDLGSSDPTNTACISGSLKTFILRDLIEFLRVQGKTGALVLSSRFGAARLELLRGALVGVVAPGVDQLRGIGFEQALAAIDDLCRWKEGTFAFHPADRQSSDFETVDLQRLVRELVRRANVRVDPAKPAVE